MMFREVMGAVLDCGLLDRWQWRHILGRDLAEIHSWVEEGQLPDPRSLQSIYDIVQRDLRFPQALFEELLDRPCADLQREASSKDLGQLFRSAGPTLRHYLLRPRREALINDIALMDADVQVKVLAELAKEVRKRLVGNP